MKNGARMSVFRINIEKQIVCEILNANPQCELSEYVLQAPHLFCCKNKFDLIIN